MVYPVLSSRARACRRDHQAPSAPLPDVGVTFVRETYPASCGDITPRSSLLRAHVPIPCGSPLLRFFPSLEESLQVATSPCCHRSGRTMARIGLRMMPPFPSSPLSSVQRVFPSAAGRPVYQTVPYPSSASSSRRMACIRPSCTSLPVAPYPRSKSRGAVPWYTTVQRPLPLYPKGPRSGPGYAIPVHHHLVDPMRPTRQHIPISPPRLIQDVFAVRPSCNA